MNSLRKLLVFFPVVLLLVLFSASFSAHAALDCSSNFDQDSPEQLQARLTICQAEIDQQGKLIQDKQREATSLERDLSIIDFKINAAKLQIQQRDINIKKLQKDIATKGQEILTLGNKIEKLRATTAELMRKTDEIDSHSEIDFILSGNSMTDFFADADAYGQVQEKLQTTVGKIKDAKTQTETAQQILQDKKSNEASQKAVQELEKQKATLLQKDKTTILQETKGQEKVYQRVLSQKQTVLAAIKNKILKFVGGGELKFPEALQVARIPEKALGVRAAFILAILTQESGSGGVIGKNLGKCFYDTPASNKSGTVMSDDQKPNFLALMKEIGRDPETTPVSCAIVSDGSYGGALGPSQFMPNTWWNYDTESGYKSRVERITGVAPASPFDNLAAFSATALYLNDALSGCKATYSTQTLQESCAAAKYYAGGNWKKFVNSYGKSVANRAVEFQKDIDILDAQP